jgi:hypothetical protein
MPSRGIIKSDLHATMLPKAVMKIGFLGEPCSPRPSYPPIFTVDLHATMLPKAVMKIGFLGEPCSPRPTLVDYVLPGPL